MVPGEKTVAEIGKHAIDKACNFLDEILRPPLKEVGLLLQDEIKYWRGKNQIRILLKAQEFLRKKKISPRKIPLRILVPLLDHGSLEEDDSMQERWAALLAKAVDPNYLFDLTSTYAEILKQLSPTEVKVLDLIVDDCESAEVEQGVIMGIDHEKIMETVGITWEDYGVLIQNLLRLNLLCIDPHLASSGLEDPLLYDINSMELTYLGSSFVNSCRFR